MTKTGNALLSVYNKKGIARFAYNLASLDYEIFSTEGTGKELKKKGVRFIQAKKISQNPNGLEDCIKTISFRIEAGIMFDRYNQTHTKEAKKLEILPIDIVVCNFPHISEVINNPDVDFNISNIDVGGPLMVRAAATNFKNVIVIVDPNDYIPVYKALKKGKVPLKLKQHLAQKAFSYTSKYDREIECFLLKNKINYNRY